MELSCTAVGSVLQLHGVKLRVSPTLWWATASAIVESVV